MALRSLQGATVLGFSLALAAPALAGNVWVVDAAMGPGAQFAEVHHAIAAASDGDLILVRSGTYASFTVKEQLTICADAGASVQMSSPGFVIAPSKSGTRIWVHGFHGSHALVKGIDGRVLLSDCSFVGPNPGTPALEALVAGEVVLDGVTAVGAISTPITSPFGVGGIGLRVSFGDLAAYGSSFTGGAGVDATATTAAGLGGIGANAFVTTTLFLSHCVAQGGKGGNGILSGVCKGPGAGGTGLVMNHDALSMESYSALLGGDGGTGAPGCFGDAADGLSVAGPCTPLVNQPTLDATTVVREGQLGAVQTSTQFGLNAVVIGTQQAFQPLSPLHGLLHILDPLHIVTMPPSGAMGYVLAELGAGVPFVVLRMQAVHADPVTQSVEFGQTCGVLLLDAAY